MATSQHIKASRTQILNSFPSNTFGNDGDIVCVSIKSKGVYLCIKSKGRWFVANKLNDIRKLDRQKMEKLFADKLSIKNLTLTKDELDISKGDFTLDVEGDIEITGSIKAPKEWKAIAEEIKEKAKTTTYVPARTGYGYSYGRQESLGWEDNLVLDEKILRKGKDLWSKYKNPQHDMDHKEMSDKMDKLGIKNPYSVFGSTTGYYY